MVEVITKEIGINQISNSFKKVKDYYLNSLNNKESLYKRVESEIFDGSSFEEVKDYFVAQTNKKIDELKGYYGYDCTNICNYLRENPGIESKLEPLLYRSWFSIKPGSLIIGKVSPSKYDYLPNDRCVEIIDFEYECDNMIIKLLHNNIPLDFIEDVLRFYKAMILSYGVVVDKSQVKNLDEISQKICTNYKPYNVLQGLIDIVNGKYGERVFKQKVYFSLLKNDLVFSNNDCEDLLLIAELKTNSFGFELFKKCVLTDEMKEFYDYVVKRIISGLKRQTSKTIASEYNLALAVKGHVPICLYTDEGIRSQIYYYGINDIKSIIRNTSDPNQVKRLVKLWVDSIDR